MINILPGSPGHLNTWFPDGGTVGRLRRRGLAGGNMSLGADSESLKKIPPFSFAFLALCLQLKVRALSF